MSDGSLRCWGQDAEANPPYGDEGTRAVPTIVEGVGSASKVVIIDNFGCAVTDGRVLCWPRLQATPELYGMHVKYPPTPIPGLYDIVDISVQWDRGIAIDRQGRLWGWGEEGRRVTRQFVSPPALVDDRGDVVRAVILKRSGCLLRRDGTVGCWGSDTRGSLGLDVLDDHHERVPRQLPLKDVTDLYGDNGGVCALDKARRVTCWGYSGSCGTGGPAELRRPRPKRVRSVEDATALQMRDGRTCVKRAGGDLWCWGNVKAAMLPEGVPEPDYIQHPACEPMRQRELPPHVSLAWGYDFVCVLQESGAVLCAGDNRRGQLGDGTFTSRWAFAPVVW